MAAPPAPVPARGGLHDVHPVDYSAVALKGVIEKVPYVAEHIEDIGDVITGCAMHINQMNMNASRLIVNRAGWLRLGLHPRSDHQPLLLLRPAGHLYRGQRHHRWPVQGGHRQRLRVHDRLLYPL